jgi:hypothetical protein
MNKPASTLLPNQISFWFVLSYVVLFLSPKRVLEGGSKPLGQYISRIFDFLRDSPTLVLSQNRDLIQGGRGWKGGYPDNNYGNAEHAYALTTSRSRSQEFGYLEDLPWLLGCHDVMAHVWWWVNKVYRCPLKSLPWRTRGKESEGHSGTCLHFRLTKAFTRSRPSLRIRAWDIKLATGAKTEYKQLLHTPLCITLNTAPSERPLSQSTDQLTDQWSSSVI